jgi:hypothetical protein
MAHNDYVAELERENAKLRIIEEQFWILLAESEHREARPAPNVPRQESNSDLDSKLRENDALSAALKECMELLMSKEQLGSFAQRGLVSSFLAWCEIEHLRHTSANRHNVKEPTAHEIVTSETTSKQLRDQLWESANEKRLLQDELDRVDLSRLQALDDVDRLQKHIATLSETILSMKQTVDAERSRAERHATAAAQLPQYRAMIAEKDEIIAQLTGELEQCRRNGSSTADLAADAARIRAELQLRRHS